MASFFVLLYYIRSYFQTERKANVLGGKYFVSFSSRSLKTREKNISIAQLILLSLHIF